MAVIEVLKLAAATVAQLVKCPELRSLEEVQRSQCEFDSQSLHRSSGKHLSRTHCGSVWGNKPTGWASSKKRWSNQRHFDYEVSALPLCVTATFYTIKKEGNFSTEGFEPTASSWQDVCSTTEPQPADTSKDTSHYSHTHHSKKIVMVTLEVQVDEHRPIVVNNG